jgi:hypothetical protein
MLECACVRFALGHCGPWLPLSPSSCATASSRSSSRYTTATSGPSRCTTACGYAAASSRPWYASSSSSNARRLGRWRRRLWCVELGRHLAAWGVFDKGRVGGQKGGFHVVGALTAVEVGGTEVGVVLWSLEGLGNGRLRNASTTGILGDLASGCVEHIPLESRRKKHSCSCRRGSRRSFPRSAPDSRASAAAARSSAPGLPWRH